MVEAQLITTYRSRSHEEDQGEDDAREISGGAGPAGRHPANQPALAVWLRLRRHGISLSARLGGRRRHQQRPAGDIRQAVQAEEDQAGVSRPRQTETVLFQIHPGRRGTGPRHPLRERLLPDDHLSLRGSPAFL